MSDKKLKKNDLKLSAEADSTFLLYQTEDGKVKIETHFENETIWLNMAQLAELFQKSRSTINEHILNIYQEQELEKESSMRKIGNSDFSTKPTHFYNLDVTSKSIRESCK